MRISNSKKQLAKIISENGGWRRDGDYAAQDKDDMSVCFYSNGKPTKDAGCEYWSTFGSSAKVMAGEGRLKAMELCTNWHQTILSRDEYFHLHPAQDADDMPSEINNLTQVDDTDVVESKPTIEQLASEYRNRQDYAERKQQEADEAKAEAEAKLAELVAAGKALGLVLGVAAPEPELGVTDWWDLQVGDWVWVAEEDHRVVEGEYEVLEVEAPDYDGKRTIRIRGGEGGQFWINYENGWRFIRRPAKEADNA